MPLLNNLLPEGQRIQNRINRILYADYLIAQTAYENGVIPNPPTFKGDFSFFLKAKQGKIDTAPTFQNSLVLSATPAPTPPSASSISIPQAGFTYVTVNWPASARATSYSYVLNGAPYTPTIDNGLSGSITLDGLTPGTPYTLVVTASGPSGTSTSPPLSIYTLPVVPLAASFIPSAQTQTGFTIGWSGAAGATRYSYRIINTEPRDLTAADGVIVTDNGLSGNSVSFAGLRTGSQYSVIVTARNPSGSVSSLPYTIFTGPAQPPPPTPSAPNLTGFTIPYPTSGGAASYTYTINGIEVNAAPAVPGFTRSGNNLIFTGLTPGIPQDLVITAVGFTGTTVSSAVTRIYTTPVSLPSSSIVKSSSGPSAFTLAWPGANSGATSYTYTVLDSLGNPVPGVGIVGDGVTGNTVSFTGLSPGVAYTMTVNAKNPSQVPAVPSASFVVYTAPAAATTLVQSKVATTQTSSTISWGGATGATGYTYVVKDASGRTLTLGTDYTVINNGMVNSSATIGGLTAGQTYSVIVVATDVFGQTSSAPIPITTAPSTPTGITQTAATQTSFTATWTGGVGATSYSYTLNNVDAVPTTDDGLTSKTITFTGLNPGDSKDLIITATNSMGDSPSARVSKYALTGPPTSLYSSAITSGGFTVNWLAPTGASSYTYTITNSSGTTVATDSTHLSTSGANYATFARLSPLTLYNVIVNADNPAPGVTPSTVLQITTGPGPSRPTGSSVSGSTTSAGFSVTLGGGTGGTGTSTYTFTYTDSLNVTRSITPTSLVGDVATFSGLPPGASYVLHVVATDTAGTPSPALDFPFTTAPGPAQPAVSTTPTTVPCGTVTGGSGTVTTAALPGGNLGYTYTLTDSSTTPPTVITVSAGAPSGGISVTESGTPPEANFAGLVPGRSYTTSAIGSVSCGTATSTASSVTPPPIPGAVTPYIYTLVNTSSSPPTTITVSAGSPSGGISVTEVGTPPVATFTGLVPGNTYTVNAAGSVTSGSVSSVSPYAAVPHTYTLVDSSTTPPTTITVAPGYPSGGISVTEAGIPPVGTFTGLTPGTSYAVSIPISVSCGIATSSNPSVTAPTIPGGTQPYTYTLVDSSTTPPTTRTVSVGNPSGGFSVTEVGTPPVATFTGLLSGRPYSVSVTTSPTCGTATSVSSSVNVPDVPSVTAPASTSVTVSSISAPPPYTYTLTDSSTIPPTVTVVTTLTSPVNGISVTESGTPTVASFTGLANGSSYSVSATGSSLPSAGITSQGFSLAVPTITGGTLPLSYFYTLVNTSTTPPTTTLVSAANSPQNGITVTESGTPPVASFTGLAHTAAYTVSVSARDSAGTNSPASAPVSFSTVVGAVAPVQGTVSGLTPFTATVPFTTPGSGSTPVSYSYTLVANGATTRISVANSPQNGISVTESAGPPRTASFTGLTMDTAYSVRVNSIDRYGSSTPSSSFTVTTPPSTPTTPVSLAFPTIGNTTVTLTWSEGLYATSYTFVVTNVTATTIVTPSIVTNMANKSAAISGLLAGFTYSITIQAVNSFGSSPVSAAGTVTTTVLVTTFASGLLGPTAITTDGTNLYVSQAPSSFAQDTSDNIIKIDSAGNKTVIVTGIAKATIYNAGRTAITTQGGVFGITYVPSRSPPLIFTNYDDSTIKACETDGTGVATILGFSGNKSQFFGTGAGARFYYPYSCTSDSNGTLYITDRNVSSAAGYLTSKAIGNTTTSIANLLPSVVNNSTAGANSVIFDIEYNRLWSSYHSTSGVTNIQLYCRITSAFPSGTLNYNLNLLNVKCIRADSYGNLIIADTGNNCIKIMYMYGRPITYNGITYEASTSTSISIILFAGSGASGSTNDTLLNSSFNAPWGVQLSADNTTLYVIDNGSGIVRSMPYVIYSILSSLPPTTPTSVIQVEGLPNQLTIRWSSVAATSYTYLIKDSLDTTVYPGIATLVSDSVTNKTASFSGLTYGQTYTVTVTATNVNGSVSSTTAVNYQPFTNLFVSGLTDSPYGITLDSANNMYITNSVSSVFKIQPVTSSGITSITHPSLGVSNAYAEYFYYSSIRNGFLMNDSTGKTQIVSTDLQTRTQPLLNRIKFCDNNGYIFTLSGTKLSMYNTTNTLVNSVTSIRFSTTYPIVVINGIYWTLVGATLYKIDRKGTLLNTYTLQYVTGELNQSNQGLTFMIPDKYGNLIIAHQSIIYIFYTQSTSFTYNGTTYTSGQLIRYSGISIYPVVTYLASQVSSFRFTSIYGITLDSTGTVLYILETLSNFVNANKRIITIPYIITNLPPADITDINLVTYTSSLLTIEWVGGGGATSYSYAFTDSSGNPLPISVSTDNGHLNNVILSGTFIFPYSFNITITASNGQTISSTAFIELPILVDTFSFFNYSFMTYGGITFNSNNMLYMALNHIITTGTGPTSYVVSISSDGITRTTINSFTPPLTSGASYTITSSVVYNRVLNLLIITRNAYNLYTSPLTPNSTLTTIAGASPVSVAVDSTGNTFTIQGNPLSIIYKYDTNLVRSSLFSLPSGLYYYGITIDSFGNIWVSNTQNNNVLNYTQSGTLLNTYSGFNKPFGLTCDIYGNIIVADSSNNLIKIIYTYPTTQTIGGITYTAVGAGAQCNIYTYAGTGTAGNTNGFINISQFNNPLYVALDNTGTTLYVSDTGNSRVRSMPYALAYLPPLPPTPIVNIKNTGGTPSSFSFSWTGGNRATSYTCTATDSDLNPVSISVITDNGVSLGTLTVGGTFNIETSYIFTITASNSSGSEAATFTTGSIAQFVTNFKTGLNAINQIAMGPSNTLYFANTAANRICSLTTNGTVTDIVTSGLDTPFSVYYNFKFNLLFIADYVRVTYGTFTYGRISTTPLTGGTPTYVVSAGNYVLPIESLTCDLYGNTYVNYVAYGYVSKIIGIPNITNSSIPALSGSPNTNGPGITTDPSGNVWFADTSGNTVIKFDSITKALTTYTGFNVPKGLCSDYLGNIIVADSGNNLIKIIYTHSTPVTVNGVTYTAGNVYTYAGSGTAGNVSSSFSLTQFNNPWCPALDLTNSILYVSDYGNNSIRSIPYLLRSTPLSIDTDYAPSAVTLNTPTSISPTGFTLSWTAGVYTNSYTYSFSTSAGTIQPAPTVINNGMSGNNIVVSGLPYGIQWTVTVTSGNSFTSTKLSSSTQLYGNGILTFLTFTSMGPRFLTISPDDTVYSTVYLTSITTRSLPIYNRQPISLEPDYNTTTIYGLCFYNGDLYSCFHYGAIYKNKGILFTTIPSPDFGIYICLDPVNPGSFYVSTNLGAIYKIDSAGNVTLFANATTLGLATGIPNKAIAADNLGNVYYIKNSTTSLMKINQALEVSTVKTVISGFGMKFTSDYSILYIAYTSANKIMKYVVSTDTLTTFAGSGTASYVNVNDSVLTSATFNFPYDVAIDSTGHNIYVADYSNNAIRLILIN